MQQNEAPLISISQLSQYMSRWRFIARVSKKNTVRTFKYKAKEGEGQLFSVELVDREGGETRATFFGAAVDTFKDLLQERQMYSFSGGRAKRADKRWCSCEHEITFDEGARIVRVDEDAGCPQMVLNPHALAAVAEAGAGGAAVDIVAIISDVETPTDVNTKNGVRRRLNMTVLDDSGASIRLTIWGDDSAKTFAEGSVMVASKVKVTDFGGCSITTNFGSKILAGDEARGAHPRVGELTAWYASQGEGAKQNATALTTGGGGGPPVSIADLKLEAANLEADAAPGSGAAGVRYHTVMPATVTFVPHDRQPFYLACPAQVADEKAGEGKTRQCNKKVEQCPDGWCCMSDHRSPAPCPRWMARFAIADPTGTQYVSTFDEVGEKMLGCPASDVAALWDRRGQDPTAAAGFENIFRRAMYKRWKLRLKAKKEVIVAFTRAGIFCEF